MNLLEKYESLEKQSSLIKFCKDHAVPTVTFHTWLKHRRSGTYAVHGKFIALSIEPVSPVTAVVPLAVFAMCDVRRADDADASVCGSRLH